MPFRYREAMVEPPEYKNKEERRTKVMKRLKTTVVSIDDIINNGAHCPLNIDVIPNYMGINLCSVDSVEWTEQEDDGQLVSLTINFTPGEDDEIEEVQDEECDCNDELNEIRDLGEDY